MIASVIVTKFGGASAGDARSSRQVSAMVRAATLALVVRAAELARAVRRSHQRFIA